MIQEKLLGAMSQVSNILTAANTANTAKQTAETAKRSAEASFAQNIASKFYADPEVMKAGQGKDRITMTKWLDKQLESGAISPENYSRYQAYMTAQSGIQYDELAKYGIKPAVSEAIHENPVVIQEKVREDQVGI